MLAIDTDAHSPMDTIAGVEEHSNKEPAEGASRIGGDRKPRQTVTDEHRRTTHAEWPSVIENLCGHNVDAGSGKSMGADSVRICWVQLRAAFKTAGVDCMQDFCDHISRSEAPILAWVSRHSRHSNLTPSAIRSRLVGLAPRCVRAQLHPRMAAPQCGRSMRVCPSLRLWERTCIAWR